MTEISRTTLQKKWVNKKHLSVVFPFRLRSYTWTENMEDQYLMAKYNYMSEYLQALYSTFALFKTTEMSPLMKHNNTMKQKDEWWKMKQNEYGNSFSDKNFVHQMIVDLFQTVVRHAFLKCPEKN